MPSYTGSDNANGGTVSFTAGASTPLEFLAALYYTESVAAATGRMDFGRQTGGATPTNQTPEKLNPNSRAADATYTKTWGTAPTTSGNPLFIIDFQEDASDALCQARMWRVPNPRKPIILAASALFGARRTGIFANDKNHWFAESTAGQVLPRRVSSRGRRAGYYEFHHMRNSIVGGFAYPTMGQQQFRMIVPDDFLAPLAYPMSAALFPAGPAVVKLPKIRVLDQALNRAQL